MFSPAVTDPLLSTSVFIQVNVKKFNAQRRNVCLHSQECGNIVHRVSRVREMIPQQAIKVVQKGGNTVILTFFEFHVTVYYSD